MRIVRGPAELSRGIASGPRGRIGFVPTMGALHDGHLSLVRAARRDADAVVVSIFVNPLQFTPDEDLDAYPRDEAGDLDALEAEGVDIVFLPSVEAMYPAGATTRISPGPIAELLEGLHRPGHFDGVCTVVAKLFNMVGPDLAYFGQKDAQQVAVIQRMVEDLDFPVEIVVCPIVREADGLAMSSRNAYLDGDDRLRAVALYRALQTGAETASTGGDAADIENSMYRVLAAEVGVGPDYAVVVDRETFGPPAPGKDLLLLVAARVGPARLIDNLVVAG